MKPLFYLGVVLAAVSLAWSQEIEDAEAEPLTQEQKQFNLEKRLHLLAILGKIGQLEKVQTISVKNKSKKAGAKAAKLRTQENGGLQDRAIWLLALSDQSLRSLREFELLVHPQSAWGSEMRRAREGGDVQKEAALLAAWEEQRGP
ncbi:MAG: hypothetical protein AAF555_05665 [Verrucomicrobiota bacterium]